MSSLWYLLTILPATHSVPQGPFPDLRAPPVGLSLLLLLGVPVSLRALEDQGREKGRDQRRVRGGKWAELQEHPPK